MNCKCHSTTTYIFKKDKDNDDLTGGTTYYIKVKARNGDGQETLYCPEAYDTTPGSGDPVINSATHAEGAWSKESTVEFTASGTLIDHYYYKWNQQALDTATTSHTLWDGTTMNRVCGAQGSWYLHVSGYDAVNAPTGAADYEVRYDSVPPAGVLDITFEEVGSSSMTVVGAECTDAGQAEEYYQFYKGGFLDRDWVINVNSYTPAGLTHNTQYSFYYRVKDGLGNIRMSGSVSKYTGALVPGAPVISDITSSSLRVTAEPNGNQSWTEFAIHETETNKYVSTTGSLVDTVDWGSYNDFGGAGGIIVDGLSDGASYYFQAKARNADSEETAYGPQASSYIPSAEDPTHIACTAEPADYSTLLADGASTVTIEAQLQNFNNELVATSTDTVIFNVSGPGALIGTTAKAATGGIVTILLQSTTNVGMATVTATAVGLNQDTIDIDVIVGYVKLAINPPAKLVYVEPINRQAFVTYDVKVSVDMLESPGGAKVNSANGGNITLIAKDASMEKEVEMTEQLNNGSAEFDLFSFQTTGDRLLEVQGDWYTSSKSTAVIQVILSNGSGGILAKEDEQTGFTETSITILPFSVEKDFEMEIKTVNDMEAPILAKIAEANQEIIKVTGDNFTLDEEFINAHVYEYSSYDVNGNSITLTWQERATHPDWAQGGSEQYLYPEPPILTMYYLDDDNNGYVDGTGVYEGDLCIYLLNEDTSRWELCEGAYQDGTILVPDDNKVDIRLEHFSVYALIPTGEQDELGITNTANYPNPFSEETVFTFRLGKASKVTLGIYTLSGRLIRTLIDENRNYGPNEAKWDGMDANNEPVANGVYFYKIISEDSNGAKVTATGKAVRMK